MQIRIADRPYCCLLDTGSEVSILPFRFITTEVIYPNPIRTLTAANGSKIELLGEAKVDIELEPGFVVRTAFLVSEFVDEAMLGLDWLTAMQADWHFAERTVSICGRVFKLLASKPTWRIRRVALQEDVLIPAHTQVTVKGRTIYSRLDRRLQTWAIESTEIRHGVRVARTIVADAPTDLLLPVANTTDSDVYLPAGSPLAPLETVEIRNTVIDRTQDDNYDHLNPLWETMGSALPESDKGELDRLRKRYSTVFSKGEWDLGCVTAVKHKINTGNAAPARQELRRQPIAWQAEIDKQLQQMEDNGIIYPVQSDWAANIVVVKKKDGSLRCCVDYRQLNERTVKDSYPLPRIDDCLDALSGAKLYSVFDLRSGYYQLEMDPADAHKTAFVTRRGLYAYRRMPMGLATASASF